MSEELKLFEGNRIRHIYDEEKEIYYFPDLNYQDAYLIKYLLENKCSINSSLKIISGNNVV